MIYFISAKMHTQTESTYIKKKKSRKINVNPRRNVQFKANFKAYETIFLLFCKNRTYLYYSSRTVSSRTKITCSAVIIFQIIV